MSDETAVTRIAAVLRQVLPVQWPHEMAARALLASGCAALNQAWRERQEPTMTDLRRVVCPDCGKPGFHDHSAAPLVTDDLRRVVAEVEREMRECEQRITSIRTRHLLVWADRLRAALKAEQEDENFISASPEPVDHETIRLLKKLRGET